VDIYEEGLLPSTKMFNGTAWTLLEDNDSKHMSKFANSWREKHNIDRISWPSNSPDVNRLAYIEAQGGLVQFRQKFGSNLSFDYAKQNQSTH
jgi:hypothetical protein